MAATPGYVATVRISGTSTSFTGEATTDVGGTHTTYQITDTTKRVLDPGTTPTVKADGVALSAALYTLNYLWGKVTFLSARGSGEVITVDGNYLPTYAAATAKEFANDYGGDLLDTTKFSSNGEKEREYGLHDVSGSLSVIEDLLTDHDSTGGTRKLATVLTGNALVVLETSPDGTNKFRGFVKFDKASVKAALTDMVQGSVSWKLAQYPGKQSFAFGT
jgi:hypothetical protein